MNKQTIIGLVLIGAILFGFSWFQSRERKKIVEQQRIEDSIARARAPRPVEPAADTAFTAAAGAETGTGTETVGAAHKTADPLGYMMAAAREAETQTLRISNEVMDMEFTSLGGKVSDVVLKEYLQHGGGPLHMFKPGSEEFDIELFIRREGRDAQINTREFNFTCDIPAGTEWREGEESKEVSMKLRLDPLSYIEFLYTVPRNDYMLGYTVNFVGMEEMLRNQTTFDIDWTNTGLQNEKGFDNENNFTTISYRFPGASGVENIGMAKAGQSRSKSVETKVNWVAFKQQFFSSVLVADADFSNADLQYHTFQPGEGKIKNFHARLSVPMERDKMSYGFRMYYGPNSFPQLKSYGLAMERIIPLGWWKISAWVSRIFVIPLFDWLGGKIASFGWIILIMTLIIKTAIFPLTFPSYKSSAKMRIIKPEVDAINAQYPDKEDMMKKQQALMALNKRAGINPLAGCIPMLIQFPVIIAMFRFFPVSIELRQQPLFWADDLSSYDSILNLPFTIPFYGDHVSLFALLMAISMFFYSWLNFKQQAAQPQMAGMKFMSLYLMPVMMLFWFNNYAAGLCFYYLLSNLFTIAQIYAVRFALNEDKLRRKMLEAQAKPPKKKSKFMQRYEDALRQQQQVRSGQVPQTRGGSGSKGRAPAPKGGSKTPPQKKKK